VPILTDRLDLRPVAAGDLDAWAALLADPEATRLLHFPEPHSHEQSADLLARTIERAAGAVTEHTVRLRETGETVGFVGFAPRTLDGADEIELGWTLFTAFQGKGYATEAARALRPLVPGRVISLIRVENAASQNVARKLGMTHERDTTWAGFATQVWAD
jgi:RimJ/RimL family protein N-acetyltransferase